MTLVNLTVCGLKCSRLGPGVSLSITYLLHVRYAYSGEWDPTHEVVIGLTKQVLHDVDNVIEHIEDLVFIILSECAISNNYIINNS